MEGIQEAPDIDVRSGCAAVGVTPATFYRWQRPAAPRQCERRPTPPRALVASERRAVLDVLHERRFYDLAPAEVYAMLLTEGTHMCSVRTMYRILAENREVRERRAQRVHPEYKKPELLATAPNQVWSWDITKLRAEAKWTYYHLYVLLDIFSRYVVGWMLAYVEDGRLARQLLAETCAKQGIDRNQLTVHADRGAAPASKTVAQLFADLAVTPSHSRPHVSNDNPFSEAHFKTLKYQPGYPGRFSSYDFGHRYCRHFFSWYNRAHQHGGIAMLTPEVVHFGRTDQVLARRQAALDFAYDLHPERFVRGRPSVTKPPTAVWINPPQPRHQAGLMLAPGPGCQQGTPAPAGLTSKNSPPEAQSRVAAGDERSELALDGAEAGSTPIPPTETQITLH